jgi:hypothetical protein
MKMSTYSEPEQLLLLRNRVGVTGVRSSVAFTYSCENSCETYREGLARQQSHSLNGQCGVSSSSGCLSWLKNHSPTQSSDSGEKAPQFVELAKEEFYP